MSYNNIIRDCDIYISSEVRSIEDLTNSTLYIEIYFNEYTSINSFYDLKIYTILEDNSTTDIFETNLNRSIYSERINVNSISPKLVRFNINDLNLDNIDLNNLNIKFCFVLKEINTNIVKSNTYIKVKNLNQLSLYEDHNYENFYSDSIKQKINSLAESIRILDARDLISSKRIFDLTSNNEIRQFSGINIHNFSFLVSNYINLTNIEDAFKESYEIKFVDLFNRREDLTINGSYIYIPYTEINFLTNNFLYQYILSTNLNNPLVDYDRINYVYFVDKLNKIIYRSDRWTKTISYDNIRFFINSMSFHINSKSIERSLDIVKVGRNLYKLEYNTIEDSISYDETINLRIKSEKDFQVYSERSLINLLYEINNDSSDERFISLNLSSNKQELYFSSESLIRTQNLTFTITLFSELVDSIVTIDITKRIDKHRVNTFFRSLYQSMTDSVSYVNSYSSSSSSSFSSVNNESLTSAARRLATNRSSGNERRSVARTGIESQTVYISDFNRVGIDIINRIIAENIFFDKTTTNLKLSDTLSRNILYLQTSTDMFDEVNLSLYNFDSSDEALLEIFFIFNISLIVKSEKVYDVFNIIKIGDQTILNNKVEILKGYRSSIKKVQESAFYTRNREKNFSVEEIGFNITGKALLFNKGIINKINSGNFSSEEIVFLNNYFSTLVPEKPSIDLVNTMNSTESNKEAVYKEIRNHLQDYDYIVESRN